MKLPTLDTDWYVLRCPARSEYRAADELRQGGYHAYVPTYKKLKRVGPHRKPSLEPTPLLASYLFLATERGAIVHWGEFRDEFLYPHVGRPLCGSNGPALVDPAEVVQIHVEEVDGLFDDKMPAAPKRRRDRIRDLRDLFKAMEAAKMDIAA